MIWSTNKCFTKTFVFSKTFNSEFSWVIIVAVFSVAVAAADNGKKKEIFKNCISFTISEIKNTENDNAKDTNEVMSM